jgi:hypothetical protein
MSDKQWEVLTTVLILVLVIGGFLLTIPKERETNEDLPTRTFLYE